MPSRRAGAISALSGSARIESILCTGVRGGVAGLNLATEGSVIGMGSAVGRQRLVTNVVKG